MIKYETHVNMTKIKAKTKLTILDIGYIEGEIDQTCISGKMYNATSVLERLWTPKDFYICCEIMSFIYERQAVPINSQHKIKMVTIPVDILLL